MYQTSILFEDYIAAVIHEEEIHIMSSSRRVVRHAVSCMSLVILTVAAPYALIAQPALRMNYLSPISLPARYSVRVRLGISATDMSRETYAGERVVPLTTILRTYRPSHDYRTGLDSTAARRVRQRLMHTAIGAVSGVAIGTAIGALIAARPTGQRCQDLCSNRGFGIAYSGAVGLLAGAVTGAAWPVR
jgi:hypothetical protein